MNIAVPQLTDQAVLAAYDYRKNWSTTAQPWTGLSPDEYIKIAESAKPDLSSKISNFMSQNGFSYVEIDHEAFKEYELGDKNFREWFNDYCEANNLDNHAQFAIMGPRVKTLESAERKIAFGGKQPDRLIDYTGTQLIALKQKNKIENKVSIDNIKSCMQAIENDPQSIARKNHYVRPHGKTGFRGHKTLWEVYADPNGELEGYSILAEIKIEHESQMDIDKFTRSFMNIDRSSQSYMARAWNMMTESFSKQISNVCNNEERKRRAVTDLGKVLYDRLFWSAGLNQLMQPDEKENHEPLTDKEIQEICNDTANKYFTKGRAIKLVSDVASFLREIPSPIKQKVPVTPTSVRKYPQ